MYYLMTRYYDPKTGRFINADSFEYLEPQKINGLNLYVYCANNPVMLVDFSGTDAILITAYGYNGLPIVGHTALAIQDETGFWYIIEYGGGGKSDAAVSITRVGYADIYGAIGERYRAFKESEADDPRYFLSNLFHSNSPYTTTVLPGDYSGSLMQALSQENDKLGGYNLLFNNCVQYISKLLKNENNDTGLMQIFYDTDIALIPAVLDSQAKYAKQFYSAIQSIFDFFGSIFN